MLDEAHSLDLFQRSIKFRVLQMAQPNGVKTHHIPLVVARGSRLRCVGAIHVASEMRIARRLAVGYSAIFRFSKTQNTEDFGEDKFYPEPSQEHCWYERMLRGVWVMHELYCTRKYGPRSSNRVFRHLRCKIEAASPKKRRRRR